MSDFVDTLCGLLVGLQIASMRVDSFGSHTRKKFS